MVLDTAFVGGSCWWVIYRYNSKRQSTAERGSHNSTLEAAWTAIPVLILVAMFVPSLRLVYYEDRTHDADDDAEGDRPSMVLEYSATLSRRAPISTVYGVQDDQLKPGQLRHLAVDNPVVLPVGKNIRILTTSADVIHSFFIPSLGVQRYAIPGRHD